VRNAKSGDGVASLCECDDTRPKRGVSGNFTAEPQKDQGCHEAKSTSLGMESTHRSSMWRVSTVAVSGGVFIRRRLVGMIMKIV
jgi:hypothetical protein